MKVLVTGSSGFIGQNLVNALLKSGHLVHKFTRNEYDKATTVIDTIQPDWVFNLASYGIHPDQKEVSEMVMVNFANTERLLRACIDVGCVKSFIHTGSCLEYGPVDHHSTEKDLLKANTTYGYTKALASKVVAELAQRCNINAITARLYAVYGPHEAPTRLIPKLIEYGMREQFPPLVAPETARDFVYVDDVVEALILLAKTEDIPRGSAFNVCSESQTTLRELTGLIGNLMGFTAVPNWGSMPAKEWDTNVWVGDASKMYQTTGWFADTNLVDGLQYTIDFYKNK